MNHIKLAVALALVGLSWSVSASASSEEGVAVVRELPEYCLYVSDVQDEIAINGTLPDECLAVPDDALTEGVGEPPYTESDLSPLNGGYILPNGAFCLDKVSCWIVKLDSATIE